MKTFVPVEESSDICSQCGRLFDSHAEADIHGSLECPVFELPRDHIAAAVKLMVEGRDLPEPGRTALWRELAIRDSSPYVTNPGGPRVGDRVMSFGYLGDDGWARVVAKDEAKRELRIRFESDDEEVVWTWGPRGGGGSVLLEPAGI